MVSERKIWKISPGQSARLWPEFREKNCIAIGWNGVGDLNKYSSDDEIRRKFREVYPNSTPDRVIAFYNIKEGDVVIAYGKQSILAVGKVERGYSYKDDFEYYHRRPVNWNTCPEPLDIGGFSDKLQRKLRQNRAVVDLEEEEWQEIKEAIDGVPPEIPEEVVTVPVELEKHLRRFLAKNPHLIEEGLTLLKEDETIQQGRPDLVLNDAKGNFLVVETKKNRGNREVVGQISEYMGLVKKHLAHEGQSVRGIIIAFNPDESLQYAVYPHESIKLKSYEFDFKLKDVEEI
ncbi:MAG: endonuclease NucS [Euryarchaeota archaeon]|nr:endonuclease NucS [Euryarchaeota archaeon]